MNTHTLRSVKVWELYRNALAVKRTPAETSRDSLYGLPGDLIPAGWGEVKAELMDRFSRSAKTIDDILSILREWEESAIRIIKDHLEIHPVLDLSRWGYDENASPIRYVLVPKGASFPVLSAEETEFYETFIKRKTGLTDDCRDWRRYWIDAVGIESDQTRTHVFRNLELSEALAILRTSHLPDSSETVGDPKFLNDKKNRPAMPNVSLSKVKQRMLHAIWNNVDWSKEPWRASRTDIAFEVWQDEEKSSLSTFNYTVQELQKSLHSLGCTEWFFSCEKGLWVFVDRIGK